MTVPYVSTRRGAGQWIMQRVSAILLIGLAFSHFALQHFTRDAVTTGLTVAARFNSPWWQGYYVLFVALALYHGVNGVVGISRDYKLPPWLRFTVELSLWTLAAFFIARGTINIVTPRPLGEVKELYARDGFPAGDSAGSPPGISGAKHYDFRSEDRELRLLAFYLERHTYRNESSEIAPAAGGASFDGWLLARIAEPEPTPDACDREAIFSSSREFAVWAANVRRADAAARLRAGTNDSDRAIAQRLAKVPPYSAALH